MSDTNQIVHLDPKTGMPFLNQERCEAYIRKENLQVKGFVAKKWQGGWAAVQEHQPQPAEPAGVAGQYVTGGESAAAKQQGNEPPYAVWVTFQPPAHAGDSQDVFLGYRGATFIYRRGVRVPIPYKVYTECVLRAQHPIYGHGPRAPIQIGTKSLLPHILHPEPCTEEEYRKFMAQYSESGSS